MRYLLKKLLWIVYITIHLTNYQVTAQANLTINKPPTLKNGKRLGEYLLLGYRGDNDKFVIITVKFKITSKGFLDTLHISNNAPDSFVRAANSQLILQNGKWNPQLINGRAVNSKWLISRYYIGGIRENFSDCVDKLQHEFFEAFKREEELFLCDKKLEPPLKCLIDYVEGYNCYLYPPLLSNTVR